MKIKNYGKNQYWPHYVQLVKKQSIWDKIKAWINKL
jgi:hypothetical protein